MIKKILFLILVIQQLSAPGLDFNAKYGHRSNIKKQRFMEKSLANRLYSKQIEALYALAFSPARIQPLIAMGANWNYCGFYFNILGGMVATDNIVYLYIKEQPSIIKRVEPDFSMISFAENSSKPIKKLKAGASHIAATNTTDFDITIWDNSGTEVATINNILEPEDFIITDESNGTVYVSQKNIIKRYLIDGSFVDTFPQVAIYNCTEDLDFLVSDAFSIYAIGSKNDNTAISLYSIATGELKINSAFNSTNTNMKILAKNKKIFALRDNIEFATSYIEIADFSDSNNPITGAFIAGEIDHNHEDFAVTDDTVFKICKNVIDSSLNSGAETIIAAWKNIDPSTFPAGAVHPRERPFSSNDYYILTNGSEEFIKIAADTNYIVALSVDNNGVNSLRSYDTTSGNYFCTFNIPSGTVHQLVATDGDKIFATIDNKIYRWTQSSTVNTELLPALNVIPLKMKAFSSFISVLTADNKINSWDSDGTHLSEISLKGEIKDFTITSENNGTICVTTSGADQYKKYSIITGKINGKTSTLSSTISEIAIPSKISPETSTLYVLYDDRKKITAIDSATGEILAEASHSREINNIIAAHINSNSFLYLSYDNKIEKHDIGKKLDFTNPVLIFTTLYNVSKIVTTHNGNLFASYKNLIKGWNHFGVELFDQVIETSKDITNMAANAKVFYNASSIS